MSATIPPPVELLPHRPPMVLIDEVVAADEAAERATARVRLTPSSPFVEDGSVDALVGVEYMAQTIGAFVGYVSRLHGQPILVGFLVGIREARFLLPSYRVGDVLDVHVRRVWGDDNAGSFECSIERGGETVATAQLQVFREPLDSEAAE